MYLTNEVEHAYRYGDHGPKYLREGENIDLGVVIIRPGDQHPCHRHEHQEESFLALEGRCDVWVDGKLVVLHKGDHLICEKGEVHFFENTSEHDFKAIFIKAPHHDEKDSVYIDWRPGDIFIKE